MPHKAPSHGRIGEARAVQARKTRLARDLGVRASLDIDVYRKGAHEVVEAELRDAASHDIGDWFRLEVGARKAVTDGGTGLRVPVTAYIGTTAWANFHVDLVGADLRMTGQPEDMPAIARVSMPEVEQHGYRVYPLVDHVADKVAATFDVYGEQETPSTRYRDLVDLVSIATGASVPADAQMRALASEAARRVIELPTVFDVPDRALWERGYATEAAKSLLPIARTVDDALAVVRPFLDALLDATAVGIWDPSARVWRTADP